MALYDYICTDEECKHEWEAEHSIKADPLKVCPKCQKESAKRLISLCGKGVVELTGQELKDSVKADANRLKKEIYREEKKYANVLGESKYQEIQQRMDKNRR